MFKFYFISILLYTSSVFSQWSYTFNFEDTSEYYNFLKIDAGSPLSTNSWQIGSPDKAIFTLANSSPNVIVTDTVNFYQSNDSSVFEIYQVNDFGQRCVPMYYFSGYYWVNSDTLTDFGKIEVSPDMGTSWIDLIDDPNYSNMAQWYSEKPTFTGNSEGWKYFHVDLHGLLSCFGVNFTPTDTIIYRFTFISDSIQTQKDGLMFDDLYFHFEHGVGLAEANGNQKINVFPNPATIAIQFEENILAIDIYDSRGNLVLTKNESKTGNKIDVQVLADGFYTYSVLTTKKEFKRGRFIKN